MNRRFRNADGPGWDDFSDDELDLNAVCSAGSLKHASRTGRKAGPRSPKKTEKHFTDCEEAGKDLYGKSGSKANRSIHGQSRISGTNSAPTNSASFSGSIPRFVPMCPPLTQM